VNWVMRLLKIVVLVGFVLISQGGHGQGREEVGPPGNQHHDLSRSVKLFPNPATDFVSVKLDAPGVKHIHFTLHNVIGNSLDVETERVDDNEVRIKVKDLPSGYYLVALEDPRSGFKGVYKFLKR